VINLISAGIRSPTENVTRSPGRRAFASGARDWPFLLVSLKVRGERCECTVLNGSNGVQAELSANASLRQCEGAYLV